MTWLKNITLCICAYSLLHTIIKLLAPNRLYPQVKTVMSLLLAITVGTMLLNIDISDMSDQLNSISYSQNLSQEDELVVAEIEARLSDYLFSALSERGIEAKKVEVKTNIDEQYCISISEAWITVRPEDDAKSDTIKRIVKEKIGDINVFIDVSEE